MQYSDVVATIALTISLLTATWAAWRSWRWNRPVVLVSGTQWIGGSSTSMSQVAGFSIEVINIGDQSTQVLAAYWQIDRGNGLDVRFTASAGGGGVDSLFESSRTDSVPEIPFILDRYGRRSWEFTIGLPGIVDGQGIVRARPVAQFTSRKKIEFAYGSWQPSQIAIEARRSYNKDEG